MDHAGAKLESSLKLLHRPMAGAHAQARQAGIMYLISFLRGRKGRGTAPFPCSPSPKATATPRKLGRLHRRLDRPQRSAIRHCEDALQPLDLGNGLLSVHPSTSIANQLASDARRTIRK